MELKEFLFREGIKSKDFAKCIGYDKAWVSLVVNGKKMPGRAFIDRTRIATKGIVTEDDLRKSFERQKDRKSIA